MVRVGAKSLKVLCVSVALAGVMGCGGAPKPRKATSDTPPPTTEAMGPLVVTANGEALPFVGMAAWHRGSSALTVDLSTRALDCAADYSTSSREITEGERSMTIRFTPMLQTDGTSQWLATDMEMGRYNTGFEPLPGLKLGEAAEGAPVPLIFDQEFAFPADEFFDREALALSLKGQAEATHCGRRGELDADPRPQGGITVKVAGRSFPIQGAIIELTMGVPHVRLTTGAMACDGGGDAQDIQIELGTAPRGGEDTLHVYMRGDILPSQFNGAVPPAALKIEADAQLLDNPDKGPRKLTIAGGFELSGYKVEINGEVEALNCLP